MCEPVGPYVGSFAPVAGEQRGRRAQLLRATGFGWIEVEVEVEGVVFDGIGCILNDGFHLLD